jgi:hypothetical protein
MRQIWLASALWHSRVWGSWRRDSARPSRTGPVAPARSRTGPVTECCSLRAGRRGRQFCLLSNISASPTNTKTNGPSCLACVLEEDHSCAACESAKTGLAEPHWGCTPRVWVCSRPRRQRWPQRPNTIMAHPTGPSGRRLSNAHVVAADLAMRHPRTRLPKLVRWFVAGEQPAGGHGGRRIPQCRPPMGDDLVLQNNTGSRLHRVLCGNHLQHHRREPD